MSDFLAAFSTVDATLGLLFLAMGAVLGWVIFNRDEGFGPGSLICYRVALAGLVFFVLWIGWRIWRGQWQGSLAAFVYWVLFAAGIWIGVRLWDRAHPRRKIAVHP